MASLLPSDGLDDVWPRQDPLELRGHRLDELFHLLFHAWQEVLLRELRQVRQLLLLRGLPGFLVPLRRDHALAELGARGALAIPLQARVLAHTSGDPERREAGSCCSADLRLRHVHPLVVRVPDALESVAPHVCLEILQLLPLDHDALAPDLLHCPRGRALRDAIVGLQTGKFVGEVTGQIFRMVLQQVSVRMIVHPDIHEDAIQQGGHVDLERELGRVRRLRAGLDHLGSPNALRAGELLGAHDLLRALVEDVIVDPHDVQVRVDPRRHVEGGARPGAQGGAGDDRCGRVGADVRVAQLQDVRLGVAARKHRLQEVLAVLRLQAVEGEHDPLVRRL
mmetsp:Transcript_42210/g.109908  ORF Transcript_42210/g.109908 Transcript_42210/m.109908 type:complete len:337 (-) Transcript_42210:904-1914(-)